MNIRYYLGWFTNYFPEKLSRALQEDITERKSLVLISSSPTLDEVDGAAERSWLEQAGIRFDDYHLINYRVQQDDAGALIRSASVIFLLGGDTVKQNRFLKDYELSEPIKKSTALILGASAGAINMSAKWLCSKNFGYHVDTSSVYDGIALNNFSVLSHFDLENNMASVQSELSSLSEEMKVYVSNKDCALRISGDKIDIFGDVYVVSRSQIKKMDETF